MIIDAHVHFWDPRRLHYPWLADFPGLNQPALLDDYDTACGEIEVEAMYFMQAECEPSQALDEVAFVTELAAKDLRIRGIVAFAPLERGEHVRPYLDLLVRNPLICGVRRMIKSEVNPDFCLQPDFIAGVSALKDYNLSFALGIKPVHVLNSAKLATLCPDVRFVVDHFAQPDIRNGQSDPWRRDMRRLAEIPNVWCKLSSIATEIGRRDWTRDDLRPYLEHVLELWGPSRTMFATDWPVSSPTATIPSSVEVVRSFLMNEDEQDQVFRRTALQFCSTGLRI